MFTSENNDITNQSVDTSFFTSEKNCMTNQLASLARRDYFHLDAFWRVNLGMYIISKFKNLINLNFNKNNDNDNDVLMNFLLDNKVSSTISEIMRQQGFQMT